MTTEAIYHKYWSALVGVEAVMVPQDAAIALALRLAIGDAYDAGGAVAADLVAIVAEQATPERSPADQRYAEQLQAQISRLNEWLEKYAPALYRDTTDTATAVLAVIDALQGTVAEYREQLVQLDADNADLTQQVAVWSASNTRLINSLTAADKVQETLHQAIADRDAEIDRLTRQDVNPTPAALPATDWGRNHPAWEALPKADLAVIDQLSSGTTTFRRINKSLRRDLVCRAIRHLASEHGGPLPSSVWDRNRPLWLPTQGAVNMLSDGGNWSSLLAMALEPA